MRWLLILLGEFFLGIIRTGGWFGGLRGCRSGRLFWFGRFGNGSGLIDGVDKGHAQAGQALFEHGVFFLGQVALGFDLEHFQLVDEIAGVIEFLFGLAGLRIWGETEENGGHIGVLNYHVGEHGGHQLVLAGRGGGVCCSVAHECIYCATVYTLPRRPGMSNNQGAIEFLPRGGFSPILPL